MKLLKIISLWSVFLSQIAYAQTTSTDSLNRAFDNCVFLHDSIVNELDLAHRLGSLDSLNIKEHQIYISTLEVQLNELLIQKNQLESTIIKKDIDIKALRKAHNRAKIKERLKIGLIIPSVAIVSGAIGYLIAKFAP